jgi:hypothetical protein
MAPHVSGSPLKLRIALTIPNQQARLNLLEEQIVFTPAPLDKMQSFLGKGRR